MTNEKIMSTICDSICRHPCRVESQAELDAICADCVVNKLEASDGDLISRADAIEACLAKAKRQHGVLYPEDIENVIDSLPSAEAEKKYIAQITLEEYDIVDGWIPCSERLPEDDELMLVNYIDRREGAVDIWIGWHEMENVWYIDGEAHGKEFGNEVIAWMPLPKPYEGREP